MHRISVPLIGQCERRHHLRRPARRLRVFSTPFGAGASDAARNAALKAGKPIWTGPVKANTGQVGVDKAYGNYDPFLDRMDFLIEGVAGRA